MSIIYGVFFNLVVRILCCSADEYLVWYRAICNHRNFYSARFTRLGLFASLEPDLTQSPVLYVSLVCKFLSAFAISSFCAVNAGSPGTNASVSRVRTGIIARDVLCVRIHLGFGVFRGTGERVAAGRFVKYHGNAANVSEYIRGPCVLCTAVIVMRTF